MGTPELHDALEAGRMCLRRYDGATALLLFERILATDPGHVEARAGAVCALWMLREVDATQLRLPKLRAEHGDEVPVLLAQGLIDLGLRDDPALLTVESSSCNMRPKEALGAYERVLKADPDSLTAVRGRAVALRVMGRVDDARAQLEHALEQHGLRAPLLVELAWLEIDTGRPAEAVKALARAEEEERRDVEWLLTEFDVRTRIGDRDAAGHALSVASEVAPEAPEVLEAWAWHMLDEAARSSELCRVHAARAEAREFFNSVLARAPKHPGALEGLAELDRLQTGPPDTKLRALQAQCGLLVRGLLGLIEHPAENDLSLAAKEKTLDASIDAEPSPQLTLAKGWLAFRRARYDIADKTFGDAHKLAPRLIGAYEGLVRSAARLGAFADADETLRDMERAFPGHPRVTLTRGWLAASRGSPEVALRILENALAEADVLERARWLVWANHQLGRFEDAETLAIEALKSTPSSADVLFEAATVADLEERWHVALDRFRRALQLEPGDEELRIRVRRLQRRMLAHPLYRLFGRRCDEEAFKAAAAAPGHPHREQRHHVDADVSPLIEGRLRAIRWRQARIQHSELEAVAIVLLVVGAIALASTTLLLPVVTDVGEVGVGWRIIAVVLGLGSYVSYAFIFDEASRGRLLVLTAALVAGGVWLVSDGSDRLDQPAHFLLAMVAVAPAVALFPPFAAFMANAAWRRYREARLPDTMPEEVLLDGLLQLAQLTELDVVRWSADHRQRGLELLELVARAQASLLGARRNATRKRRRGDDSLFYLRSAHRAASVAAATRDLKDDVLAPEPGGGLRERVLVLLDQSVTRRWGGFASREPDPLPTQLRARVATAMRLALLLAIVAGVVLLLTVALGAGTTRDVLVIASAPALLLISSMLGIDAPSGHAQREDRSQEAGTVSILARRTFERKAASG